MIVRLILLIALAVLGWWLWRWSQARLRQEGKAFLWKGLLTLAVFVCVVLAVLGKLNWLAALGAGALALGRMMLPTLIKLAPTLLGQRSPVSTYRTTTLEVNVHNASGAITGVILSGPFAGSHLEHLSPEELQRLIAHCRQHDPDAIPLLQAFAQRQRNPGAGESMTREEALAILGLEAGASADDIQQAHRRLIQRMHPDRGGSEYLASRINQARDVLLG